MPHEEVVGAGAEASHEEDQESERTDALMFAPNGIAAPGSDISDADYDSVPSDIGRPLETIYEVDSRIGSALPSAASELAPESFTRSSGASQSFPNPTHPHELSSTAHLAPSMSGYASGSQCIEEDSMSPIAEFAQWETEEDSAVHYRSHDPLIVLEPSESSSSLPLPSFDSVMDSLEPLPTPEPSTGMLDVHTEAQRNALRIAPSISAVGRSRSPTMSTISGIDWFPVSASLAAERPSQYDWPALPSDGDAPEGNGQEYHRRSASFGRNSSDFSTSTPLASALSLPQEQGKRARTLSLPYLGFMQGLTASVVSGLPFDSSKTDDAAESTIARRVRSISSYFSSAKSVYSIAQRSAEPKSATTSYLSVLPPVLRLYTASRSVFLSPSAFAVAPVAQSPFSSWRTSDVD